MGSQSASPTREAHWIKQIRIALEADDCLVLKIHGGMMQAIGLPDLCIQGHGWMAWLEVKAEAGTLSAVQAARIVQLLRRGALAFPVTGTAHGLLIGAPKYAKDNEVSARLRKLCEAARLNAGTLPWANLSANTLLPWLRVANDFIQPSVLRFSRLSR